MSTYQLPYQDRRGFTNCLLSAIGGDGANMAAKLLFKLAAEVSESRRRVRRQVRQREEGHADRRVLTLVLLRHAGARKRSEQPPAYPLRVPRKSHSPAEPQSSGLQENATVIVNTCETPERFATSCSCTAARSIRAGCGEDRAGDAFPLEYADDGHARARAELPGRRGGEARSKRPGRAPSSRTWPPTRQRWARSSARPSPPTANIHWSSRKKCAGRSAIDNMLDGGAIDALTHSTIGRNNAYARSNPPPAFNREACIDCAKCLTVCADPGAIVWKDGKMAGIDLTYCKACMRCVAVCPETKKGKALKDPAKEGVTACAF